MPTPIAHALGGITAGCLVLAGSLLARGGRTARDKIAAAVARIGPRRALAGLACIGMLPDLDLFFGTHRGASHSLGAAFLAATIGAAITPAARLAVAAAVASAFASHTLLDWLGTDPGPPYGIMAWWPWTEEFFLSEMQLFMRVCREYWCPDCWRHNALALLLEIALLAPLAVGALLAVRRALRGSNPR